MADVIKPDDLFAGGLFDEVNKGAAKATELIKELTEGVKDLSAVTKEKLQIIDIKDYQSLVNLNKTIDESNKQIKLHTELSLKDLKVQQQEQKLAQEQQKTAQQKIKTERELSKTSDALTKQKEKEQKAQERVTSAYKLASSELNKLKLRYKDLVVSGKGAEQETKNLQKEILNLDAKLREADFSVKDFNRNVGNYKNAIREAFQSSGVFGGQLGQLVDTLGRTAEGLRRAGKEGQGFGTSMKLLGGGIILGVIAGIKALYDSSIVLQDAFSGITASLKDLVGNGFSELDKAQKKFRDTSHVLREELNALALDQEDFNEIANDETLGFKTREKALKNSLVLEQKRAALAKEIAQQEFDIAQLALKADKSLGSGQADPKVVAELEQKTIALANAQDDVNDATRHYQEQLRDLEQKQLKRVVDALESTADATTNRLKKQIEDEKIQLEQREKIIAKAEAVEQKLFEDEIKAFEKVLNAKLDGNALLKKDGVALQAFTETANLSSKAQAQLIGAINKRQASILANEQLLKKLEEDKLKRQQKLLEIQRQIAIDNQQAAIQSKEEDLQLAQASKEKNLEKIFEKENVFDKERKKARKIILEREQEEAGDLLTEQIKLLELQRDAELAAAQNSITDLQVLEETKQQIRNKFRLQEEQLANKFHLEQIAQRTKDLDDEKKIREQQFKIVAQYASRTLDALQNGINKREAREQESLDRDIERNAAQIERQRELAEKGADSALAFEEANAAKLELKREQQAKKEERRQMFLGFLKSWAQYAEQDPNTALQKATRDLGIAKLGELLFLAEGDENIKGPGTATSDSIPAMLSRGESVATAAATSENPGLVTAMNSGKVDDYFAKTYLSNDLTGFAIKQGNESINQLKNINSRLQSLENTIQKKPENTWKMDNLGNVILTQVEKGLIRNITFKTRKPRI